MQTSDWAMFLFGGGCLVALIGFYRSLRALNNLVMEPDPFYVQHYGQMSRISRGLVLVALGMLILVASQILWISTTW